VYNLVTTLAPQIQFLTLTLYIYLFTYLFK